MNSPFIKRVLISVTPPNQTSMEIYRSSFETRASSKTGTKSSEKKVSTTSKPARVIPYGKR